MKVINGKVVFEMVDCWDCKGSKEVTRYIPCPGYGKPTYNKECLHCHRKGKYGHVTVGSKLVLCSVCDGVGKRMQDPYDHATEAEARELVSCMEWESKRANVSDADRLFIGMCYSPRQFFGATDYVDHSENSLEKLRELIEPGMISGHHQIIHFIDRETMKVATRIVASGYQGGYTAYLK